MHKIFKSVALSAALLAGAVCAPAHAAVTYTFKAISAFDSFPFGTFQLTTANFVTGANTFGPASLTSCSVTFTTASSVCGSQVMDTTFNAPYETVAFGTDDGTQVFYYFNAGSFGTVGTHSSQIFGDEQFATLSVVNSSPSVPEPATWAMMIIGFGAVGGAMRRRKANTVLA